MAATEVELPLGEQIQADVTIYDVGHGNSALVRSGEWTVLVDIPPVGTVFEDLANRGINRIDHLVISHAERDHLGGAMRLLDDPDIEVGALWVNPDATKAGQLWERFRSTAYRVAQERGVDVGQMVTDLTHPLVADAVRVEFLHPDYEWAMGGAGSGATGADSNTLSVVVRVWLGEIAAVVLAADLTELGLSRLEEIGTDLTAQVLVFPHHGGLPGTSDVSAFGERVAAIVRPSLVFFSFGRAVHANPRPDAVQGVRSQLPMADIRCTQLSRHCAGVDAARPMDHLGEQPASGRAAGISCLGTLRIRVRDGVLNYDPPLAPHDEFVGMHADEPLCRRHLVE